MHVPYPQVVFLLGVSHGVHAWLLVIGAQHCLAVDISAMFLGLEILAFGFVSKYVVYTGLYE
jgi:hypothetical protein